MSLRLPWPAFLALLFSSGVAHGQGSPTAASDSARTRFNAGLAHAAQGEIASALLDFEAAYALKPHYSVLYNIGQAQAALGRPAEAVRNFERYLAEGGKRVNQARHDEVRALIATNRAKLGEVRLLGVTATTRVWVDGVEIEQPALAGSLQLTAGKHGILSSNGAGFPQAREVSVGVGSVSELNLAGAVVAAEDSPPALAAAQLRIVCDLPGVDVDVGETTHAKTPVKQPLTVTSGPLVVRFSRAGYRPVTHHVVASPPEPAIAMCDQVPEQELQPAVKATLVVQTVPFDAQVFIDGERFLGAALPYGPHEMRVERSGFVTERKPIALRQSAVTTYQVTLTPTPTLQAERAQAESRRKLLGFGAAGGGIAFGIASGALFGWNSGRYDDWRRSRNQSTQLQTVTSIQRVDDLAAGCAVLGAGLVAAGAWLLFSGPAASANP